MSENVYANEVRFTNLTTINNDLAKKRNVELVIAFTRGYILFALIFVLFKFI